MDHIIDHPIARISEALRARKISAVELTEEAIRRHDASGDDLHAYRHFDTQAARSAAERADELLAGSSPAPPMCGIPVSVKDLYGVQGMPTFAGTARQLPESWSRDAWLVARLREQGAVLMGKTHTVEMAYGGVGINPHWGTPINPWDDDVARIPGGSSCGAGVSLWEGSALVALGTDTGGSIRIPASLTGTVGHKTTHARWSVDGVVPLSTSLDSVGALTRTVEDSIHFFGSIDPDWGDPQALLWQLAPLAQAGLRAAVPECSMWNNAQPEIIEVLGEALTELSSVGWAQFATDGSLIDEARDLYLGGGIAGAECNAFLDQDLPEWREILHPTVGSRLEAAPALDSDAYRLAVAQRRELMLRADSLFEGADVLILPTATLSPPSIEALSDLEAYGRVNGAVLSPTCPISLLGLCAVTVPAGLDAHGMPVGLQLVAPASRDETLLGAALGVEQILGTARNRMGRPPRLSAV